MELAYRTTNVVFDETRNLTTRRLSVGTDECFGNVGVHKSLLLALLSKVQPPVALTATAHLEHSKY